MKRTTFNFGWTVQEGVQDPFGAISIRAAAQDGRSYSLTTL